MYKNRIVIDYQADKCTSLVWNSIILKLSEKNLNTPVSPTDIITITENVCVFFIY